MPEYLKGNYKSPEVKASDAPEKEKDGLSGEFEKRALERLGGSIAFVMKSKTFLWSPEDGPKKS